MQKHNIVGKKDREDATRAAQHNENGIGNIAEFPAGTNFFLLI